MRTDASDIARTRQAYDAVAKDYARLLPDLSLETPLDRAVLAAFAEMLREQGDTLVADIGCGAGRVTEYLHDAGLRVIGLDLSPEMVRIARARCENLSFAAAHAGALPLRTDTVGGLVAWYSLINMPTGALVEIFAEFARATRPGATILVAFQAGDGQQVDRATSYEQPVSFNYYRHAVEDVSEALEEAGFALYASVRRCLRAGVREYAASRAPGAASLVGDRCRCGFPLRRSTACTPTGVDRLPLYGDPVHDRVPGGGRFGVVPRDCRSLRAHRQWWAQTGGKEEAHGRERAAPGVGDLATTPLP